MMNTNSLAHVSVHQIQCQEPDWQDWVDMKLIQRLLVLPHSKKRFKGTDNLLYQYNCSRAQKGHLVSSGVRHFEGQWKECLESY